MAVVVVEPRRSARPASNLALIAAAAFALSFFYAGLVLQTAWVNDDAYITFRTIDNAVHGHGLRWNVEERVQAYTHPLWMGLIWAGYALSGNIYLTALILSGVCSALALVLVFGLCRTPQAIVVAGLCLGLSKAYVEYSTSGLENPLTHLLLAALALVYLSAIKTTPRLLFIGVLGGLAMLNRMDTILFFLPVMAFELYRARSLRTLLLVGAGFLPVAAWEVFSVVYYGFLFPNTAYAKLNTGIPQGDLAAQGVGYFMSTIQRDPHTLVVIAAGLLLPVLTKRWAVMPLVLGALLYMAYTIRVGGDFMTGRFFTPPLLIATALLATHHWRIEAMVVAAACFALLQTMSPYPIVLSTAQFGADKPKHLDIRMVGDERLYYFPTNGLPVVMNNDWKPTHPWAGRGDAMRRQGRKVHDYGAVGMKGFFAGPDVIIVDYHALSEPLLARLPVRDTKRWNIGHFIRTVPPGYRQTLLSGENKIHSPGIAAFYDKLHLIVRGPLWSRERWGAIWSMNTGAYDHFLDPGYEAPDDA